MINISADDFSERLIKSVTRILTKQGHTVQKFAQNIIFASSTLTLVSMGFSYDDHAGEYVPFMYVQASITDNKKIEMHYDQSFAIGNKSEAGQSSIYHPNNVTFKGFDNLTHSSKKW